MQDIKNAVEKHRQLILDAERYIWQNPETGYKEYKTSKYMEEAFENLGYSLVKAENITGFYTIIDTGRPGPHILIMGDLSCVMPVVHPYAGGATGRGHGNNYYIEDPVAACVDCAKWQLAILRLLLDNNGERAYKIKEEYKPLFESPKAYLSYIDSLNDSGDRIVYNEDKGTASVRFD